MLAKSATVHVGLVLVGQGEGGGEVMEVTEKETVEGAHEEAEKEMQEKAVENLWYEIVEEVRA